eukprot:323761-Chlamydomonas_euryale.AAC.1
MGRCAAKREGGGEESTVERLQGVVQLWRGCSARRHRGRDASACVARDVWTWGCTSADQQAIPSAVLAVEDHSMSAGCEPVCRRHAARAGWVGGGGTLCTGHAAGAGLGGGGGTLCTGHAAGAGWRGTVCTGHAAPGGCAVALPLHAASCQRDMCVIWKCGRERERHARGLEVRP